MSLKSLMSLMSWKRFPETSETPETPEAPDFRSAAELMFSRKLLINNKLVNGGGNHNIPIRRIRQTATLFLIL